MIKSNNKRIGAFAIAAIMAAMMAPALETPSYAAEDNANAGTTEEQMPREGEAEGNVSEEMIPEESEIVPEEMPTEEALSEQDLQTEENQQIAEDEQAAEELAAEPAEEPAVEAEDADMTVSLFSSSMKKAQSKYKVKRDLPTVKFSGTKRKSRTVMIKWKKISKKNLKKVKYVQIQYSTNKKFKKGVRTVYASAKNTSKTIKKLARGKRYYIRVRAYKKKGITIHVSKWSAVRAVKIKSAYALYTGCLKSGNTVYCCTENSLYKVNLKSGKAKRFFNGWGESSPSKIAKKGKYLYYLSSNSTGGAALTRVNVNTGKSKRLCSTDVSAITTYYLGKTRIYYRCNGKTYSMKYSGKDKKRVNKKLKVAVRKTNAKGYKTSASGYEHVEEYLVTPSGKTLHLGSWDL